MSNKEVLIQEISEAFKEVKLEDGIGLWEAQGHDDRVSDLECKKLRAKDEKEDWNNIPLIHLYQCSSSLTFFDAKGMRFHTPMFLLYAIGVFQKEQQQLQKEGLLNDCSDPDIENRLQTITDYAQDSLGYQQLYTKPFSLFSGKQLKCIIKFLEFKLSELEMYYKSNDAKELGLLPTAVKYNKDYMQLQEALNCWIHNFEIE
ncbi:DUF6714 family protein [Aquimarina megaterium]|uniref:DUF6714 family protein n=1 Tax=Aquimarina megaterium TaxID=1443666 RepID=UPI0004708646|nr:DUF6714 family protein [Aquimarina megaterium]